MEFPSLLGNSTLKESLRCLNSGTFPHASVIEGPPGCGKRTLSIQIAMAILCGANAAHPCGTCASCAKIVRNSHADVILINPEGLEIKIDEVRALRRQAYVLPNEGEKKIFIIHAAHLMNVYAQNALLKILEEPPGHAVFILLCENRDALLPTILSRCVSFQLAPLSEPEMLAALKDHFPNKEEKDLRFAAMLSQGAFGRAAELLCSDFEDENLKTTANFFDALSKKSELALFEFCHSLETMPRAGFALFLDTARLFIRNRFAGDLPASKTGRAVAALPAGALMKLDETLALLRTRCDYNAGLSPLTGTLCIMCAQIL